MTMVLLFFFVLVAFVLAQDSTTTSTMLFVPSNSSSSSSSSSPDALPRRCDANCLPQSAGAACLRCNITCFETIDTTCTLQFRDLSLACEQALRVPSYSPVEGDSCFYIDDAWRSRLDGLVVALSIVAVLIELI